VENSKEIAKDREQLGKRDSCGLGSIYPILSQKQKKEKIFIINIEFCTNKNNMG